MGLRRLRIGFDDFLDALRTKVRFFTKVLRVRSEITAGGGISCKPLPNTILPSIPLKYYSRKDYF